MKETLATICSTTVTVFFQFDMIIIAGASGDSIGVVCHFFTRLNYHYKYPNEMALNSCTILEKICKISHFHSFHWVGTFTEFIFTVYAIRTCNNHFLGFIHFRLYFNHAIGFHAGFYH